MPELEAISRRLAQSDETQTRSFAQEILAHRGVTAVATGDDEGVFVDPKTGIAFVRIRAGEFQMGSEAITDWEKPIHLVRITQDFMLGNFAWYEQNSGNQTQPVGAKKSNPWSLHDMHGNVWEWCADWCDKEYYARSPEVDPPGPEQAAYRVFRGGSWADGARSCRSAYRSRYSPEYRFGNLGFRLAAVPPSQQAKNKSRQA